MQRTRDTELIQRVYAAFGKGDIATILAAFAADGAISFEGASARVPWHRPCRGHAEIPAFFAAVAESVDIEKFEPVSFVSTDGAVAVQLEIRYRVRRTGKQVEQRQVHWWTMKDGKIANLQHFEDTRQVDDACR